MTLLVGIDLGERRIGLAVAEDDGMARAHRTIPRGATAADDVRALLEALPSAPDALILGLPLEASGVAGPQTQSTRAWAAEVEPLIGLPILFRDERLSSHLAEQRLGSMKRGRSGGPPTPAQRRAYRERVDREAAAVILQDELDARSRPGGAS